MKLYYIPAPETDSGQVYLSIPSMLAHSTIVEALEKTATDLTSLNEGTAPGKHSCWIGYVLGEALLQIHGSLVVKCLGQNKYLK